MEQKFTAAKTWVAALGVTATAITTALAAVQLALADDAVDVGEISSITAAVISAGATIYGVWRTKNQPIERGTN